MKNSTITTVIGAVVIAAIAFFGGVQYQKSQRPSFGQQGGVFARRFGGQNAQAVRGQIVSADNNSITVKMQDGSTKLIILPANTTITKATTGSKNDLKTGVQVVVFGTSNSDGSVTATMVSLNSNFGRNMSGAAR